MKPLAVIALIVVPTAVACAPVWNEQRVEDVAMKMIANACDEPNEVGRHWLTYDEMMAMTRLRPSREQHGRDIWVWIADGCRDSQRSSYGRLRAVGAVSARADGDPRLVPGVVGAVVHYVVEDRTDGTRSTPGHAVLFVRTGAGWRLASEGDASDEIYLGNRSRTE